MLYYEEIFYSIQGECRNVGVPTVFIRLYGCPIGCSYCDQKQESGKRISIENIVNKVMKYKGAKNVCITGGEPLIYDDYLMPLVWELMHLNYKVEIETSGCFKLEELPYNRTFRYIMDVKCPSSGVTNKNVYDNLLVLTHIDDVVFVIKDRKDYDFTKKVLKKYPTSARIYLSPMFKDEKPLIGEELVKWICEDKLEASISIQMHKILCVR